MEIKSLVKNYAQVMSQLESLTEVKNSLREEILHEMGNKGLTRYEDDEFSALIAEKVTFKYTDEKAMVSWLRSHGMSEYVEEKVSTSLNSKLKKDRTLNEGMGGMFVKNFSNQLIVKKVEEPVEA